MFKEAGLGSFMSTAKGLAKHIGQTTARDAKNVASVTKKLHGRGRVVAKHGRGTGTMLGKVKGYGRGVKGAFRDDVSAESKTKLKNTAKILAAGGVGGAIGVGASKAMRNNQEKNSSITDEQLEAIEAGFIEYIEKNSGVKNVMQALRKSGPYLAAGGAAGVGAAGVVQSQKNKGDLREHGAVIGAQGRAIAGNIRADMSNEEQLLNMIRGNKERSDALARAIVRNNLQMRNLHS